MEFLKSFKYLEENDFASRIQKDFYKLETVDMFQKLKGAFPDSFLDLIDIVTIVENCMDYILNLNPTQFYVGVNANIFSIFIDVEEIANLRFELNFFEEKITATLEYADILNFKFKTEYSESLFLERTQRFIIEIKKLCQTAKLNYSPLKLTERNDKIYPDQERLRQADGNNTKYLNAPLEGGD